jgi:hypothetical protein
LLYKGLSLFICVGGKPKRMGATVDTPIRSPLALPAPVGTPSLPAPHAPRHLGPDTKDVSRFFQWPRLVKVWTEDEV